MLPLVPIMKPRLSGNVASRASRAGSVVGVTTTSAQRPTWQLILPLPVLTHHVITTTET